MKIAEWLYTNETFTYDMVKERAVQYHKKKEGDFVGDFLYITYHFEDGSSLTLGDNGYMGGKW